MRALNPWGITQGACRGAGEGRWAAVGAPRERQGRRGRRRHPKGPRRRGAKEVRGAGRNGVGRERGPARVLQRHRAGRAGSAALAAVRPSGSAPLSPQASRSSCGTPCTPPRRPSSAGACWPRRATSPCSSWVSARGPAAARRRRVQRLCVVGSGEDGGQGGGGASFLPAACHFFSPME